MEGVDNGFHKEAHEAEFDAVFFTEVFLKGFAEAHHGAHVALVESGEDGGGVLGFDELRGDLAAQGCHFFSDGAGVGGSGRGRSEDGSRSWSGGGFGSCNNGCGGRRGDWSGCRSRSRCGRGGGCSSGGGGVDLGDELADFHLGAFGDFGAQDTGGGGVDLLGNLVGFEREEEFVGGDLLAVLFVPDGEDSGGDGLADGWNFDFDFHALGVVVQISNACLSKLTSWSLCFP